MGGLLVLMYLICSFRTVGRMLCYMYYILVYIFLKSCNLNFCTCFKVCSIRGFEVVLTTSSQKKSFFGGRKLQA